jgi:hypothetical protein
MSDDGSNSRTNANNHEDATLMTCDVLCSLGAVAGPPFAMDSAASSACASMTYAADDGFANCESECPRGGQSAALSGCPKQHQLPMFLSSKCTAYSIN